MFGLGILYQRKKRIKDQMQIHSNTIKWPYIQLLTIKHKWNKPLATANNQSNVKLPSVDKLSDVVLDSPAIKPIQSS